MSSQNTPLQMSLNKHIIAFLQTNKARFTFGDNLLEISMASRKIERGEKRKEVLESAQIQLKSGESVSLDNLADNAEIAFKIRIIRTGLNTNFTHQALSVHNETEFMKEDIFLAWYDGENISLERDSFLGETIDSAKLAGLIRLMVKQGKNQKSANNWRIVKGKVEYRVNGEWV